MLNTIIKFFRDVLAHLRAEQVPWAHKIPRTCAQRAARFQ